jgi:predicted enzyme related to lactoylglutathione lyase
MVGQICWLEVPCKSVPRAAAFYSAVLGWACADPEKGTPAPSPGTESVHMFKCGLLTGAFTKMASEEDVASVADSGSPGRMPVLATYFVQSIDEALAKVEEAGGKVHVYVASLSDVDNLLETVLTTSLQSQDRDWRQYGLVCSLHRY